MEELSYHLSDFLSEGISINEDFMQLEPINHWRGVNFVKLDIFDYFELQQIQLTVTVHQSAGLAEVGIQGNQPGSYLWRLGNHGWLVIFSKSTNKVSWPPAWLESLA